MTQKKERVWNDPPPPTETGKPFPNNEQRLEQLLTQTPSLLPVFIRGYIKKQKRASRLSIGITLIIAAVFLNFAITFDPQIPLSELVMAVTKVELIVGGVMIILAVVGPKF